MNSLMKNVNNTPKISQLNLDTENFSAIDFNIKENDIIKLVDLGYDQTRKWFDNFSE